MKSCIVVTHCGATLQPFVAAIASGGTRCNVFSWITPSTNLSLRLLETRPRCGICLNDPARLTTGYDPEIPSNDTRKSHTQRHRPTAFEGIRGGHWLLTNSLLIDLICSPISRMVFYALGSDSEESRYCVGYHLTNRYHDLFADSLSFRAVTRLDNTRHCHPTSSIPRSHSGTSLCSNYNEV